LPQRVLLVANNRPGFTPARNLADHRATHVTIEYRANMAQTLTSILVHFIFSTKRREPTIPGALETDLHAYIGGICRSNECVLRGAGGMPDHIHLLISLSKTICVSDLMRHVKSGSSAWLNDRLATSFRWQEGYAGFSIGQSQVEEVRGYLAKQKEHHKRVSFQEELLAFLRKYHIEYDERYIWT